MNDDSRHLSEIELDFKITKLRLNFVTDNTFF